MPMVVMFSDFGLNGPYTAQVEAVVYGVSAGLKFVDLISNAPKYDPFLSSFLLAACAKRFPPKTVFICVVDPGVGTAQREPVVVTVGGQLFIGPDNGLFDVLVNQCSGGASRQMILWQPEELSASFHGRDLFAPIAAKLASGGDFCSEWLAAPTPFLSRHSQLDTSRIIYIDDFGNAMTGVRVCTLRGSETIKVKGKGVVSARTFGDVPLGQLFCYENSLGLLELAVNRGSARDEFELKLGDELCIET